MEAVSAILKLAEQIAKAAETARRNRARCRDLADRALTIGDNLRDFKDAAGSGGDTASRRSALGRLKAALDDALRLVQSRRRQSRWIAWLTSGRTAARFQDVEGRITACVVDLGLVKLLQSGPHGPPRHANTRDGTWKKKETDRSATKKKKDGAKNGGGGGGNNSNSNKGKKKEISAKSGNKIGGPAAAASNPKKKGGGKQGWNRGSRVKGKPAAAPAPRRLAVHSMEDDPGSCSVM